MRNIRQTSGDSGQTCAGQQEEHHRQDIEGLSAGESHLLNLIQGREGGSGGEGEGGRGQGGEGDAALLLVGRGHWSARPLLLSHMAATRCLST